jgi:hypothetical protein
MTRLPMSDAPEIWFDKGVTEGLPLAPPTRERVAHARDDRSAHASA